MTNDEAYSPCLHLVRCIDEDLVWYSYHLWKPTVKSRTLSATSPLRPTFCTTTTSLAFHNGQPTHHCQLASSWQKPLLATPRPVLARDATI